jgi:hypothetical protein
MSFTRIAIALALLASGCGAAQGGKEAQCKQECASAYMSCLEQGSCVDSLDGQIVPCERECGAGRDACEGGC